MEGMACILLGISRQKVPSLSPGCAWCSLPGGISYCGEEGVSVMAKWLSEAHGAVRDGRNSSVAPGRSCG